MNDMKTRFVLIAALTIIGVALVLLGLTINRTTSSGYAPRVEVEKYPSIPPKTVTDSVPPKTETGAIQSKTETEAVKVCESIRLVDDSSIPKEELDDYSKMFKNMKEDCIAVTTLNESRCKDTWFCTQTARIKKDPSICDRLPKDEFGESTYMGQHFNQNRCYVEVSKTLNDPSLCDRIVIDRDMNASDDWDVELLGRIALASCRAYSRNNSMLCLEIPTNESEGVSEKYACRKYFALETGNASLCDKVDGNWDDGTRPLCYLYLAEKKKDKKLCNTDEIIGFDKLSGHKIDCLAALDNPLWCEEFSSESEKYRKEWCYELTAELRKEPDLCRNASSLARHQCLMKTAYAIAYDDALIL